MTDKIIFSNKTSENEHNVKGGRISANCRRFLPTVPFSRFSEKISFTVKIDPYHQNYISLKLNSKEAYTPIFLYIGEKQLGYAKCSDFEALNLCYGNFNPEGFFFVTTALPLSCTKGKKKIALSLCQSEPYDDVVEPNGSIYELYSATSSTFPLPENTPEPIHKDKKAIDIQACSEQYINSQIKFFTSALQKLKVGEKLSITKYVEELRHFCMMLFEPYCPGVNKEEIAFLVLNCVNEYVKDYFENPTSLLHTTHQSDWGGYYGELGQALYLIEPFLERDRFNTYLSTQFNSSLTKKEAWEICLKANFDFASCRQSYIYNQTYYTYEGAWKAMAGLGVIKSKYYIGKEKCDLILKEALGIAPWCGEHILFDENGRELNLYHCLFNHDKNARFTDDFINIVCTGKAVQGKDEQGGFLRRKPYGENYFPLTHTCLSRENGYVGNYGETCNYLPEWVYRTFNHGDFDLSDEILKASLENLNSRLYMRYSALDNENHPSMFMEQAIDERNPTMNPKSAYGAIISDNRTLLFASLKRHMEEHKERYTSHEWDKYKSYANKALDALYWQNEDGNLNIVLDNLSSNYNDFKIDRTVYDVSHHIPTSLLPHADLKIHQYDTSLKEKDFVFFDIDNLLLSLRDGDTHIFAQLNHRNRGYSGFGRAHIIENGTHHLTQFATEGIFKTRKSYFRQQNVNMDFIYDSQGSNSYSRAPVSLEEFSKTPQAVCGEEIAVTYQEGVGEVLRENFEVDTPYTGYPDIIWCKIADYFIICNTTRDSYKNALDYTFPVKIEGEEIILPPFSYRVIKTKENIPSTVKLIKAKPHQEGICIYWKEADTTEYNLYRNGVKILTAPETIYIDTDVNKDEEYTYSVTTKDDIVSHSVSSFPFIPASFGDLQGFGKGNDYKAKKRNITDGMYYNAKIVTTHSIIESELIKDLGIMVRDEISPSSRYGYIGEENGKLVVRTRSKNTLYTFTEEKLSPLYFEFESEGVEKIKLEVDKEYHTVSFFVFKDNKYSLIHKQVLPLGKAYYSGTASLKEVTI